MGFLIDLRPMTNEPYLCDRVQKCGRVGRWSCTTSPLIEPIVRTSPHSRYPRLTVFAACASPLTSEHCFLQFHAKASIGCRLTLVEGSGLDRW
jgi:hypothetical protein